MRFLQRGCRVGRKSAVGFRKGEGRRGAWGSPARSARTNPKGLAFDPGWDRVFGQCPTGGARDPSSGGCSKARRPGRRNASRRTVLAAMVARSSAGGWCGRSPDRKLPSLPLPRVSWMRCRDGGRAFCLFAPCRRSRHPASLKWSRGAKSGKRSAKKVNKNGDGRTKSSVTLGY